MLHEVENFPPRDLQKHYIIKQRDYNVTELEKLSVQVHMHGIQFMIFFATGPVQECD
jgi:hypothetical protein